MFKVCVYPLVYNVPRVYHLLKLGLELQLGALALLVSIAPGIERIFTARTFSTGIAF